MNNLQLKTNEKQVAKLEQVAGVSIMASVVRRGWPPKVNDSHAHK